LVRRAPLRFAGKRQTRLTRSPIEAKSATFQAAGRDKAAPDIEGLWPVQSRLQIDK
jgi:hypothetical protein